jgi:hypothetical protein
MKTRDEEKEKIRENKRKEGRKERNNRINDGRTNEY